MDEIRRVCLSEISELITKGTTPTTIGYEFQESGINFLKIECFDENGTFIESKAAHISEGCNKQLKRSQLKAGDILFSIAGAIGRVAIVTEEMLPANTNQALAIIRITRDDVYLPYVKLILTSPLIKAQFEHKKQGVAQLNISLKDINDLEIPLPGIKQQIALSELFAKVNRVISARQDQLHALDTLIKARFVEMFGDVEQEDTLLNLCNIIDYRGKTPEKVEDGLPFITAKNVRMHQLSIEPREYISKEVYDSVMTRGFPREGDVVFTTEAPLGNVCRLPHFDTEFYVGQRIVTLQTEKLAPAYLEYALDTDEFRRKVEGKSSGSTVTGIRVRLLEQLTIPVPNRASQEQFAAFVSQVDKSKLSIQQGLEKLETLKKSLMQQYFG